ncbi:uncharacterized protein LOC134725715 isoform X2 [Mytilus trossulus]|uniref:uncharacterized protein LOC134725715 isoform X2 n=1 Tax=Mytilus trossulus TaxID=6551 RepID=UPI003005EE99
MQSQCLLLCFLALVICQGTETVLDLFPEYKIVQRKIDALENDNKALKVEIAQIKASVKRQGCQSGVFGEHAYPEIKFPASGYITFNPPFSDVPALVYGLYLYDTSKDSNSRLVTDVTNLSKSGFNMKIYTYADTKMWGARMSWMACPKATVDL